MTILSDAAVVEEVRGAKIVRELIRMYNPSVQIMTNRCV
jgi:hypothetical protein